MIKLWQIWQIWQIWLNYYWQRNKRKILYKETKQQSQGRGISPQSWGQRPQMFPVSLQHCPAESPWRAAALGTRLPSARRWLLVIRRPTSFTKAVPQRCPKSPKVTIIDGIRIRERWRGLCISLALLWFLQVPPPRADSKADLGDVRGRRQPQGQVASQSRHLPLTQGTRVAPSGSLA